MSAIDACAREWLAARSDCVADTAQDVRKSEEYRAKLNRLSDAEQALAEAVKSMEAAE